MAHTCNPNTLGDLTPEVNMVKPHSLLKIEKLADVVARTYNPSYLGG